MNACVFAAGAVFPYNEEMISRERLDRNSAVIGGNSTLLTRLQLLLADSWAVIT